MNNKSKSKPNRKLYCLRLQIVLKLCKIEEIDEKVYLLQWQDRVNQEQASKVKTVSHLQKRQLLEKWQQAGLN